MYVVVFEAHWVDIPWRHLSDVQRVLVFWVPGATAPRGPACRQTSLNICTWVETDVGYRMWMKLLEGIYLTSGSVVKNPCANAGDFRFSSWIRKLQCAPGSLPGKSLGQRSLVGYSPWGCKSVGHDLANKQQKCSTSIKRGCPLTDVSTLDTVPQAHRTFRGPCKYFNLF